MDTHVQTKKLGLHFISYAKSNSKCILYLNVRVKTTKILGENIELNFHDSELGNVLGCLLVCLFFVFMCACVGVDRSVHVSTGVNGCQKRVPISWNESYQWLGAL